MNANIGSLDRQLRIGGGFILITLALTGVLGPWAWIGVVPIATGAFNLCPLYSLIGVNSCSIEGIETNVDGWSPYIAGALVGLLAIASVYLTTVYMGKSTYLGASTTFVRAAGFAVEAVDPAHVAENAYYLKEKVKFDWQFLLIIGIFFGSLLSSTTDKSFKLEGVPEIWSDQFGPSVLNRALASFVGGIVAMTGARLADGCPSGHGLSGMMQLSVSSFVALALFFGFGAIVANLMYRKN
jgi:hypothetical protein